MIKIKFFLFRYKNCSKVYFYLKIIQQYLQRFILIDYVNKGFKILVS